MQQDSSYKLIKIPQFCGRKATFYTVVSEDGDNLFNNFLAENSVKYTKEVKEIISTIRTMANDTGARSHFFKEKEGTPGDGVCALYDLEVKNLRLYCIRYGTDIVVLGGGGYKPKTIKALQEDPKLTKENLLMRKISVDITNKIRDKDLSLGIKEFNGDLNFNFEN